MTAKRKIAISLPGQLVTAAKSAVRRGRAARVSAYVAEASVVYCARQRGHAIVTSDPNDLRRIDRHGELVGV